VKPDFVYAFDGMTGVKGHRILAAGHDLVLRDIHGFASLDVGRTKAPSDWEGAFRARPSASQGNRQDMRHRSNVLWCQDTSSGPPVQ
jgi:hypothetical protein